jgi:hypothetical protein
MVLVRELFKKFTSDILIKYSTNLNWYDKVLTQNETKKSSRRATIESVIGHLKSDYRRTNRI